MGDSLVYDQDANTRVRYGKGIHVLRGPQTGLDQLKLFRFLYDM